ncbi:uncharacterized protein LOC134717756 [Mytilus trossulus]|uniref:uncharacterized protein LOC134717756 n=1 Tax=Mytilus trossulus TaxID=6551 RepID=UPI003004CA70
MNTNYLPYFLYKSKFTGNMWKLMVHLIWVLLHGISTYGFFDIFEYPHSANLTIDKHLCSGAGCIKKVKVSFPMVGHTHEDVDQVFFKSGKSSLASNQVKSPTFKVKGRMARRPLPPNQWNLF